jgi:hypothetical protein
LLRRGLEESGLTEKESGAELLGELVRLVRRFVVLSAAQADAWALWVVHTHALDAAEETPYLWITSPEKRSGKTRLLEVSRLVVARPWFTGRVSAAALVRKVDKTRPTLLLDESDAAFNGEKDYAEVLRGLLNTGHRADGTASLVVGQGAAMDVRDFSTFCPKAIAGIGGLPDTVADRAIPIRLRRRVKTEKVERFREKREWAETAPLRARLEGWALANMETLRTAAPELPDELTDRAQDGAEPLLAIADLVGADFPMRARGALLELCTGETVEDESLGVRLLRDIRALFDAAEVDRFPSADLVNALGRLEESPWSAFGKGGKPLTVHGLARLLHRYDGVASGTIRLDDGTTAKGYYRARFEDAWSRYLPISGPQDVTPSQINTGAAFPPISKRHSGELVTDQECEIVNADGPCDAVTDEPQQKGRAATSAAKLASPAAAADWSIGSTQPLLAEGDFPAGGRAAGYGGTPVLT